VFNSEPARLAMRRQESCMFAKSVPASRVRLVLYACVLPVLTSTAACAGVAPDAVQSTSSSITAQVALAKASLVACRGGDVAQCDSADKNLDAVAATNADLARLAAAQ
jgi:hypothetical protein